MVKFILCLFFLFLTINLNAQEFKIGNFFGTNKYYIYRTRELKGLEILDYEAYYGPINVKNKIIVTEYLNKQGIWLKKATMFSKEEIQIIKNKFNFN